MLKAHFGWSNNSFNELLCILGSVLRKDNKVPVNTYRVKMLILPTVSCIGGQYKSLESCPHCAASRYKRNADYCVNANEEGASGGPKKKATKKILLLKRFTKVVPFN